MYYQYYRKNNSWKEKNNALKYLSFIHKPELRFHYRFLSVQNQTKKWSFENLPPFDLVYAFLSRSFRFFSHFWPVVWHLWRFISALITPTCNSAAKHQFYKECEITCTGWYERATSQCVTKLKGKNTCDRFVFISNRSDAGKPFQTAPAHQLCILEGWYVFNRAPLWPLEICLFLAFAHNIDHRVTKTMGPHTFKKFTLCKHSLSLAQYTMRDKEEGNKRRSFKIKFSVFALSFGVFYRLLRSRWKPIQSYQCFEF